MPDYSEQQTLRTINKRIHKTGRLTAPDAAMLTGLGVDEVSRALEKLMEQYECKLQVTDQGELIYDFGRRPKRRGRKSFGEIIGEVGDWLWKAFKIAFKVCIVIMLLAYFVFYLTILLVIVVALSKNKKGKRGSSLASSMLKIAFHVVLELFKWDTILSITQYRKDKYGYSYKTYKPKNPFLNQFRKDSKKQEKRLIATVFDFVFGPERVKTDPLANHKEVATFLREQSGIVVLSELKALAGWNSDDAQKFFSDCIVRFRGETKVSDNGVFYGDFYDFTRKATDEKGAEIIWYWDEYEPEFLMTGNSKRRNLLIAGMNTFNLVFAAFFINTGGFLSDLFANAIPYRDIILGWIPFVFSLLFFFIPVVRFLINLYKKHRRHITNIKKRLMKIIFIHMGENIRLEEIEKEVNNKSKGEELLPKKTIKKVMEDVLYDWEGELELTESNVLTYKFQTFREEITEASRMRAARKDANLGNVIFDTSDF